MHAGAFLYVKNSIEKTEGKNELGGDPWGPPGGMCGGSGGEGVPRTGLFNRSAQSAGPRSHSLYASVLIVF